MSVMLITLKLALKDSMGLSTGVGGEASPCDPVIVLCLCIK